MPKIFNNLSVNNGDPITGWGKTKPYDSNRIANIADTIGAGMALEKLGTSIPSPFARILLFKTAFEQVNAMGLNHDNIYGKLVSECLDFIEFLFLFGNSNSLTVKVWNVTTNLNTLKNSINEGHNKLASSLERFARNLNVQDIYLFYYNNVLIGGSSPYTLVYTSPNWQRIKPATTLSGLAGNELFADYASQHVPAVPLANRDKKFREMLTDYIVAYRANPIINESALRKYIYISQQTKDNDMKYHYAEITKLNPMDPDTFASKYGLLDDGQGSQVDIKGLGGTNVIGIAYTKANASNATGENQVNAVPEQFSTDYRIKTTINRSGASLPLALNEAGVNAAYYVGGRPWDKTTQLTRNPEQPLSQRILPGGHNINYPYVTDADFLEDSLLMTCYKINEEGFKTYGAPKEFLLPLKPRFFDYFNVDDINSVTGPKLKIEKDGNSVVVTLSLPIECKSQAYIDLKKTYSADEIIKIPATSGVNLAIFPSYKIIGGTVPNRYSVMVSDSSSNNLREHFYKIDGKSVSQLQNITKNARTKGVSAYIDIADSFDFIVLEWGDSKGMIIPAFKEVTPSKNDLPVGIDFGTSNSYICISPNTDGSGAKTLEILKESLQVLTLNKINLTYGDVGTEYMDSFPGMPSFNASFDREFAPLLLGGEKGSISLPYRTVVCESDDFKHETDPKLFADINVGFNFLRETVENKSIKYVSDIKWSMSDNRSTESLQVRKSRVKAFCEEMAWLIKNYIMLSDNPSSNLIVYLTQPHTMSRKTRNSIEKLWQNAFDFVMGSNNVKIKTMTESIAPFFFMLSQPGAQLSSNAVNVDIGGGSTDMLFADVENKKFYYDSSLFAGNDIWGDGKPLVFVPKSLQNGFVALFENLLENGEINVSDERKNAYFGYKKFVEKSEDLMNYIFRYEDEFHFSDHITTNENLSAILVTHLAALVFHIAQVLKDKGMDLPTTITFSGMGSKYISIIAQTERDCTDLVGRLLTEFTREGLPSGFKVRFQESPKEITAKGAVLENHPNLSEYNVYEQSELCVYGFEGAPESIFYGDSKSYKSQTMDNFNNFIDQFFGNKGLMNFLRNDFDFKFSTDFINTIKSEASNGFDVMTKEGEEDEKVNETLFFWTLKNGLFEASKLK